MIIREVRTYIHIHSEIITITDSGPGEQALNTSNVREVESRSINRFKNQLLANETAV